jgi:acyl carrier protein
LDEPDVEATLIEQLARNRGCTTDEVRLELERRGGIDSMDGLVLAIAAERTFGISISDDELERSCRSFPDLVGLVRSKLRMSA